MHTIAEALKRLFNMSDDEANAIAHQLESTVTKDDIRDMATKLEMSKLETRHEKSNNRFLIFMLVWGLIVSGVISGLMFAGVNSIRDDIQQYRHELQGYWDETQLYIDNGRATLENKIEEWQPQQSTAETLHSEEDKVLNVENKAALDDPKQSTAAAMQTGAGP